MTPRGKPCSFEKEGCRSGSKKIEKQDSNAPLLHQEKKKRRSARTTYRRRKRGCHCLLGGKKALSRAVRKRN